MINKSNHLAARLPVLVGLRAAMLDHHQQHTLKNQGFFTLLTNSLGFS